MPLELTENAKRRQVYIQPVTNKKSGKVIAYMVCYVTRRKGQHYSAAQFESLDSLMTWLATQPQLALKPSEMRPETHKFQLDQSSVNASFDYCETCGHPRNRHQSILV